MLELIVHRVQILHSLPVLHASFAKQNSVVSEANAGRCGVSPLEGVDRNEVRAQGETSPSYIQNPERTGKKSTIPQFFIQRFSLYSENFSGAALIALIGGEILPDYYFFRLFKRNTCGNGNDIVRRKFTD